MFLSGSILGLPLTGFIKIEQSVLYKPHFFLTLVKSVIIIRKHMNVNKAYKAVLQENHNKAKIAKQK